MYEEVGEEALGEVLDLFTSEVDEGLLRLAEATTPKAIAAEFHFLKGAALNLGFEEVVSLCAQGEANASAGRATEQERLALTRLFPQCCVELRTHWRTQIKSRNSP